MNLGKKEEIDEVWAVTTDNYTSYEQLGKLKEWLNLATANTIELKYFIYSGITEILSENDCLAMSDLILRTVLHAREHCAGGKLILSITGGRKTMSSDMQRAAGIFGCHALIHVAEKGMRPGRLRDPHPEDLVTPLPPEIAEDFFPLIIEQYKNPNHVIYIPSVIQAEDYPIKHDEPNIQSTALTGEISHRLLSSQNIHYNAYISRTGSQLSSNFHVLQQLNPQVIHSLEREHIGFDKNCFEEDRFWLRQLPKADLHCHMGGILDINGLITVADSLKDKISSYAAHSKPFMDWTQDIIDCVGTGNINRLKMFDPRSFRAGFEGIPEPLPVAALINAFESETSLLDKFIYDRKIDNFSFSAIGFEAYERLGDMQGSSLLQSEATIRSALRHLKNYCIGENIRYLELRCSPCKYTRGGLTAQGVLEIIHSELTSCEHTVFRIIIIGSRHGNKDEMAAHIDLVLGSLQTSKFTDFIAGFDLAGDEYAATPSTVREKMLPLLENCIRLTIHAGEGTNAKNIWEAVYLLNANRIGHGLTLVENKKLMPRFIDRRVFVEMCPSSNFQIIGYNDFSAGKSGTRKEYPLEYYLRNGLKVTVNTDNPGISRTNLTEEYLSAGRLTPGGLSKWDILQIIRNGFQGAFVHPAEKKNIMLEAEKELSALFE